MANYYNPYQNQMYNPYFNNVQPQTIQQGGFVPVSSEKEAMDYLVAQGTSVTFIDGKNKKMYIKERGFSPVEQPVFKRYDLVEIVDDEIERESEKESSFKGFVKKDEIEALKHKIEYIESQIKRLNEVKTDE